MDSSVPCIWRHVVDRGNFTFLHGGATITFLYIILLLGIFYVFQTDWFWRGGDLFCNPFLSVPVLFSVGWGTALQARRSRVRFPMVSLEFFICHNLSGRTVSLGSNQPLTEMSTRNIYSGVKTAVAYGWRTSLMCRLSWNLGASNSSNSQGLSRPLQGLIYLYLFFLLHVSVNMLCLCGLY